MGAESGAESGAETGVDSEAEGVSSSADGALLYTLPMLARTHCDVDQHLLPLRVYRDSIKRLADSPHVAVPFAATDDVATCDKPMEEYWEGRAFDTSLRHDLEEYPHSLYKSLHVVWYKALGAYRGCGC